MADRPIIFSAPMVRALLAGRKTQTRRLAASPLRNVSPGDRLYVREGFTPFPPDNPEHPHRWGIAFAATGGVDHFADAPSGYNPMLYNYERWTPSIHMPRWASRLTLVVEAVKVEQLQAIGEKDAAAEGCHKLSASGRAVEKQGDQHFGVTWPSCRAWYADLWDTLHIKKGERWEDDPAVVVLTFRVVAGNIDRISA